MYVLCGKLNFTSISEICEGGADLLACPRTVMELTLFQLAPYPSGLDF